MVIYDPLGNTRSIPIKMESQGNHVTRMTYTPKEKGPHRVVVRFAGQDVPKSPFDVDIASGDGAFYLILMDYQMFIVINTPEVWSSHSL